MLSMKRKNQRETGKFVIPGNTEKNQIAISIPTLFTHSTKNIMTYLLMIGSAIMNWIAQILRKISTNNQNVTETLIDKIISTALNPRFLAWAALYGISIIVRLYVLSQEEVSTAYPILAIAFVVVSIGWYFLWESMSPTKILGILAIIIGVILLTTQHG